jgi:ABC-2 type transport system ATP-binding protein
MMPPKTTANENFAIDVTGLRKSFGNKPAVIDVALQVKSGEIFGFLGPNGSGKTTTIRMICGLLIPDGGSGHCLGYNILTESLAIKLQVGYMTQQFSLYADLSIQENLNFIARLYNVPNRKKIVADTIADLGLTSRAKQLAGTLSGGWKQRLALSAALIHSPKLLLLDEPTAGVDPKARRDFWAQIHSLSAKGITTLVSTHYMDEAERCHRLAYISQGRILIRGTQKEIIAKTKLITWTVTGGDLTALSAKLKNLPGIETVMFGNSLHVNSENAELIKTSIKDFQVEPYRWELVESSLEDIFIHMVS